MPDIRVGPGEILIDRDYAALTTSGFLVAREQGPVTFQQAALDVHMSDDVKVRAGDGVSALEPLDEDGRRYIVINPGEALSVKTAERFCVPPDMQGQVSPKAVLTTLGLTFATTHVDPGYTDHLYLPIVNAGQSPVKLEVGRAIGKVQFERLRRAVQEPWQGSSGFRDFAAELIVDRRPLEERLRRTERTVRWLTLVTFFLLGVIFTMLWDDPVSDLVDGIEISDRFSETVVAPIVVGLLLAGVVAAWGSAMRLGRAIWTKIAPWEDSP